MNEVWFVVIGAAMVIQLGLLIDAIVKLGAVRDRLDRMESDASDHDMGTRTFRRILMSRLDRRP